MIEVKAQNCNNIAFANMRIVKDTLNIRYAMNGTGKSTIAKAIQLAATNGNLNALKTFGSALVPTCEIVPMVQNALIFDEAFVKQLCFAKAR
ncbi:MAG: hypothetical protein ACOH2B_13935 [Burkholderiaceae bacterium]